MKQSDAGPARGAAIEIPWPMTIPGLYTAWCELVAPIQQQLVGLRGDRQPVPAKYLSIAGGVSEDKKRVIEESGLLESAASSEVDDEGTASVDPAVIALAAQILEATTAAGVTRPCNGHPETVRAKSGPIPVVCFNCHAPSRWPGSPEQLKDDVKDGQIKAWMRSAMECIALMLEELDRGSSRNVSDWSKSAGISTDKILAGTKRRVASRDYARRVTGQLTRLAYLLRFEPIERIAAWLTEGGLASSAITPAVLSLALAVPEAAGEEGTLAALGTKLKTAHMERSYSR